MLRFSTRLLCAAASGSANTVAVSNSSEDSAPLAPVDKTTTVAAESIKAVHSWRNEFNDWKKEEDEFEKAEAKRLRGFDRYNIKALDEELEREADVYLEENEDEAEARQQEAEDMEAGRIIPRPDDDKMDTIVEPLGLAEGDDGSASVRGLVPLQGEAGETHRWVQKAKNYKKVDKDGKYIVNHSKWHENMRGELAYRPPQPGSHIEAVRFGYNVISVKKHVTWWEHYQATDGTYVSYRYAGIQVAFYLGISVLCAFLITEAQRRKHAATSGGNLAGENIGRGVPDQPKIAYSIEEQEERAVRAHEGFLRGDGHGENFMGNKDYQMKKIPRPKEFSYDTSLAELGVQQPAITRGAQRLNRDMDSLGEQTGKHHDMQGTTRIHTPYDDYSETGVRTPKPMA